MDRKKELKLAYLERKIVGGVYCLKNTQNGKRLILSAMDLAGSKNFFEFAQKTNTSLHPKLNDDHKAQGSGVFAFEVLEEMKKKVTQTDKQFKEQLKQCQETWTEKFPLDQLY